MSAPVLRPTTCPICNTTDNDHHLHDANFSPQDLSPEIFSARRLPDRIHYRMVRCKQCGLVRSNPIADPALLAELYLRSEFTYGSQIADLITTYSRYLQHLERFGVNKERFLEIGCGNGFFLSEARAQGYGDVRGVEPSADAVAKATDAERQHIVCDIMRPAIFPPASFDVICLFQVFDHISDPSYTLKACADILRPGGLILFVHHNIDAFSARILGSLSPIVDIEHTFLYSPKTLALLCRECGLQCVDSGTVFNTYSISYLVHLLPIPEKLKKQVMLAVDNTSLGRLRLRVPLGNMYLIARKEGRT